MDYNVERLPRAVTVSTFGEAKTWVEQFVAGYFRLLFLIGRPGLSKSQMVQNALGDRPHAWFESHATELAFYCKLYEHKDQPVVIDDETSLVKHPGKLTMMNSLCQTNLIKTLRWDSTTRLLKERGSLRVSPRPARCLSSLTGFGT